VNGSVRTWPALDIHPVSELVQAALVDYEATAVDERSSEDWRVFFTTADERARAGAALHIQFPDLTITPIDVPDENWAARSQASLRAVHVGNIIVAPPWDVPAGPPVDVAQGALSDSRRAHGPTVDPEAGDLVIVIQPSMGFGTGHHATTRLCLAALQRLDLGGKSVLDVGTGSGVLAIAASLLGAGHVVAIDDDADAISSARENVELNPLSDVALSVADLRSATIAPADVVLANLTGGLLAAAAPTLQGLTARGGRLILSGLMAAEEPGVLIAFAPWRVEHRMEEDEWVCLTIVQS
jgi:ribosomal protein L11 methyltransferase